MPPFHPPTSEGHALFFPIGCTPTAASACKVPAQGSCPLSPGSPTPAAARLAGPHRVSSTFADLMSRCTILRAWRYTSARATSSAIWRRAGEAGMGVVQPDARHWGAHAAHAPPHSSGCHWCWPRQRPRRSPTPCAPSCRGAATPPGEIAHRCNAAAPLRRKPARLQNPWAPHPHSVRLWAPPPAARPASYLLPAAPPADALGTQVVGQVAAFTVLCDQKRPVVFEAHALHTQQLGAQGGRLGGGGGGGG